MGLDDLPDSSVAAVVTDPPYGLNYQNHDWDKNLPDPAIWQDAYRVLKPGGFLLSFSSIRLQHRMTCQIEDAGFVVKDVLMWAFLNGMPKSRDIGLEIDKALKVESQVVGEYNYVQGYKKGGADNYYAAGKKKLAPASEEGKKYGGFGMAIKPAYEPIIMVQKPVEKGSNVAQNMIKHGTGAMNLEETRIPYEEGEGKVGHNPHPVGRVMANVVRSEAFEDGYDKFFLVPKVRQKKDSYNYHPTIKPVELLDQLVKLVTASGETVLDPFMGSGTTGVAALQSDRQFIGYELDQDYMQMAQRRLESVKPQS